MSQSLAYLKGDEVVGIRFQGNGWSHTEGEETNSTIEYTLERPVPFEYLVVDGGNIRELVKGELEYKASIIEGEEIRTIESNRNILVHGEYWKVGVEDRENLQDGINEAILRGYAEDVTQDWILANGTSFPATATHLHQVLSAYRQRKKEIFDQYIAWLMGGSQGTFTYTQMKTFTF